MNEIAKRGKKSQEHKNIKNFTNHEKKLSNCLMVILEL